MPVSRPAKGATEVAKLLAAAKDRHGKVPWRVIEAETGIIKSTREGWFRIDGNEPPLGPIVYLAAYLGVAAEELVAAALADYRPPTASPEAEANGVRSGPAGRPSAIQDSADVASARDGKRGARTRRH